MATYFIHEDNMPRLEDKIKKIKAKCIKFGNEFNYQVTGERLVTHEDKSVSRFVQVEVSGIAKIADWLFVGSIDHTPKGNIISSYLDLPIPEYFRTCPSFCMHCNTQRARNNTYILINTNTAEWKQVGSSCLRDFLGVSAESYTAFLSSFNELAVFDAVEPNGGKRMFPVKYYLQHVIECYKHWGYHKYDGNTGDRAFEIAFCRMSDELKKIVGSVDYNAERNEAEADEVIEWAKAIADNANDYMYKLKVACTNDYIEVQHTRLVASGVATMNAWKEKEVQRKANFKPSNHVGVVGLKIQVNNATIKYVFAGTYSFNGYQSSDSYKYVMATEEGNVFTWSTGKYIGDVGSVVSLIGTVKEHTEYREVKQTVLTRCKVLEVPKCQENKEQPSTSLDEIMEMFE